MRVQLNPVPVARIGSLRIAVIIGGAYQSLVTTPASLRCDAVVYLDVAGEIRAVRSRKGVLKLTLASGETISTITLNSECEERLRKYFDEHAGVNLSNGLAQLRAVGDMVVKQLVSSAKFQEFLRRELFGPLLILHNGTVDELILQLYASGSGGTGGPGLRLIAEAVRDMYLSRFDATVQIDVFRCGSMTHEGVGTRVHPNFAATLTEDVDWVTLSPRDPREVRRLYLLHLPMVENDRIARDCFAREVVQAFRSEQVIQRFGLQAPNATFDSRFGPINILRPYWQNSLAELLIAAEVANNYHHRLSSVISALPIPGFVRAVAIVPMEPNDVRVRCQVEEIANLVRNSRGVEPPDFEQMCLEVEFHGNSFIEAQLADGRTINVTRNGRALASRPCSDIGQYEIMITETKALELRLTREIRSRESLVATLDAESGPAKESYRRIRGRLFPRSPLARVCEWFRRQISDPEPLIAELQAVVHQIRKHKHEIARLRYEIELLQSSVEELARERATETARLKRAVQAMQPLVAGLHNDKKPLIQVAHIDGALDELLQLTNDAKHDRDDLVQLLATRVSQVTIDGLAQVCDVTEARPASIARKLANGSWSTAAPPWDGNSGYSSRQHVTVLPPVSLELLEEIRAHVRKLDDTAEVVRGEIADGGVNVVRLEIFSPSADSDIFNRWIQKDLKIACNDPALFFPNGMECIENLGLMANGDGAMHVHPK